MSRVLVRRHADVANEVSGVTRSGEDTSPVHRQVERHLVDSLSVLVHGLDRNEPDHRAQSEKNLGVALSKDL